MPYKWQKGNDIENQSGKRNYKRIHVPCNKTEVFSWKYQDIHMNTYEQLCRRKVIITGEISPKIKMYVPVYTGTHTHSQL